MDKNKTKPEQLLEKARALMEKAYAHLDQYETAMARKLGKELVAIGYSGGYEILSSCFQQENKPEKAIEILKEGSKKIPEAWALWRNLGNAYSDLERYDLAHDSYKKALACPGVDEATINFEIALAFYRQRRHLQALAMLEQLPEDWLNRSAPLKSSVLNGLQRWDETINLCRQTTDLAISSPEQSELSRNDICSLFTELAVAVKASGKDEEALELIKTAVGWGSDHYTLQKLRELRNLVSEKAKHYRLRVEGKWHEPFSGEKYIPGFYKTYLVVADSPEEALSFAGELEPTEVAASLMIDEIKELEEQPNTLKGIYEAMGYTFFGDE